MLRAVWLRLPLQRGEPAGELYIAVTGERGECAVAALRVLRPRMITAWDTSVFCETDYS